MKKLLFLVTFFLLVNYSFSQQDIHTKAKVKTVNVYRYGAELQNEITFSVSAGMSKIVVGNISEKIDEKSIQIGVNKKNISILSSQFIQNYSYDDKGKIKNSEMKKIADSIKIIEKQLTKTTIQKEANQKTIELLDKNQTILVGSNSSNVAQLTQLTQFYTKKRIELSNKLLTTKEKIKKLNNKLAQLKRNLAINQSEEKELFANGVLVLQLMSKTANNIKLNINYLVQNASWYPYYEIKGNSVSEPLQLNFKAVVKQNTGVRWKNVTLSLINGSASRNNTAPTVYPWFLQVENRKEMQYSEMTTAKGLVRANQQAYTNLEISEDKEDITANAGFSISSNQLNMSYNIATPYDILSNNEKNIVSLYHQEIPAEYTYFTAPNIKKEAFLVAKIKNFSDYGLVSAPANIIFENMYIGETNINTNTTNNKLGITLGNDTRISIKRENIKDKSGEKFLSSYTERMITYDLIIKNNKKETINIEIKDRIPLSKNKVVTIELLKTSNAKKDTEKGLLTWQLKLKPSETKKIRVSYKVKHPKEFQILNL